MRRCIGTVLLWLVLALVGHVLGWGVEIVISTLWGGSL